MGRASQMLLTGEKVPVTTFSRTKTIRRNTGRSGTETLENEAERLLQYISPTGRSIIRDRATADMAFSGMLDREPDLKNLFVNASLASKENFKDLLVERYAQENLRITQSTSFLNRKGKPTKGRKISPRTYAQVVQIATKQVLIFRDVITGRFKSPKDIKT